VLTTLLRRIVPVREGETTPMLLATLYGFLILFGYYIIRPVRDEISSSDRGNLQILWTAVFLAMLVAVPAYSAIVARWSRARFIPFANRFFWLNLLAFYAALTLLPATARPWIDRVFYVWSSMFALFVVTVFWGFAADLFRNDQGKRLYGFVTVGSSLGGIAGSFVTSQLAEHVAVFTLLLLAIVPLELSAWVARALHGYSVREATPLKRETGPNVGGSAWSGIGPVFRSPYLRRIATFLALMTFCSTILYFQQAHLVGEAITDRGERREFLARIDLWVNLITIGTQGLLTAHIIRAAGIGITLATVPFVTMLGFLGLGVQPLLWVLVAVQVIYRSGRYALAKPAREVLFTLVSREERYKSKAFIDAAVYRGGDLVSGWIYAGLAALGLSIGAIALISVPFAAAWMMIGLSLGRQEKAVREETGS